MEKLYEKENYFAKLLAANVRNTMEDFHHKYLSDAQMKELNPIIRDAIYTALVNINTDRSYVAYYEQYIPDYWEDCKYLCNTPIMDKFCGQKVVFIGRFKKMDKYEAMEYVWNHGGVSNISVSYNTSIVVIGETQQDTKNMKKLNELSENFDIKRMSEDEFIELSGIKTGILNLGKN